MATQKKSTTEQQDITLDEQIQEKASELENLDLENLDLEVEAIDERVSPSETNVFDK
ncbi:MAG: hypothetical protein GY930_05835 [bacterium]|nr:hypothetical protein [bacterium]